MAENDAFFTNMKVPELRKFLKERGIQISVNGKRRKRAKLLELCKNAAEIKVPELVKKTEQCYVARRKTTFPSIVAEVLDS